MCFNCDAVACARRVQEVWDALSADLARLGLGEHVAVSAEHGDGLVDIHDVLLPVALEGAADDVKLTVKDEVAGMVLCCALLVTCILQH